eukprot:CAMPEP_0115872622 /NCGR_PEP_ID=MMETSP0287-20121206/23529_1 /TAXON_ID=412157 /ORGANISM="Chrysochromulina rotalis, Strain UIO044" /LENGTH=89 /DNA_ID=CAMNT_0003327565 /DNA_START=24 /DNA_END=293 /DNA_ORIENTATION=+
MAANFGSQVVEAHRQIECLISELSRGHRSEAAQLQRLQELSDEHASVTDALRKEVENAELQRVALRRDLDELLDGIQATSQASASAEGR